MAKGVVQGSKTKIPEEKPDSSSFDEESTFSTSDESGDEKYKDAPSRTGSEPATEKDKDGAQDTGEISPNANDNEPLASTVESSNGSNEKGDNDLANPQNYDIKDRDTENKGKLLLYNLLRYNYYCHKVLKINVM